MVTLEARARRVVALAEILRNKPRYVAFMEASEELAVIMASGWPEELALDWLRLRQGFMPPVPTLGSNTGWYA